MADNKQYMVQQQEHGAVMISEDVITIIVSNAVAEVDGVVGLNNKPGSDIADKFGKKAWGKGIKVNISEDNEVSIDCNINIGYGQSVVDVAKSVQEAIISAMDTIAGVKLASININVCGIIRQ